MRSLKPNQPANKKPDDLKLYFNEDPFKLLGKKVRLASGGPVMTAVAFTLYQCMDSIEEWRYECGWFDKYHENYCILRCNGNALNVVK